MHNVRKIASKASYFPHFDKMSFPVNNTNLKSNYGSMTGQLNLHRNESGMSILIRNLSSGLRIHSGRDDPAGFISSSILRTEIVSTKQAITNCTKASSVCTTADNALAQVNTILVEMQAMVVEAANTGVNNEAILKSLQLQIDASLDSIDRIANTTKFMGQNLLDGSLEFVTYGLETDKIVHSQINQADFGLMTEKEVSVKVQQNAQPAVLFYQFGALNEKATFEVGGKLGYEIYAFDQGATVDQMAQAINMMTSATGIAATVMSQASPGNVYASSYGKDNDVIITASKGGYLEGNVVVKYTAPKEGNGQMYLNVNQGDGNSPTEIEVVLQTEQWKPATYHYNGENDGIPHNEFNWKSKLAGSAYNDVQFTINNVRGTDDPVGLKYDLTTQPYKIEINVDYDATDPQNPENTTVNDLKSWLLADPTLSAYFEIEDALSSDGTGPIVPTTIFTQSQLGVDGGKVLSTAEQVAKLLNTSPLLQDEKGNGTITASIPAGSTGLGVVAPFEEYAYYGTAEKNNQLQFLGPGGSPNVRFMSTPGTPLSVDYDSFPPVYGKSTATVQGFDANTTFSLRANNPGDLYDGLSVIFQDGKDEAAVLDPAKNAVVITVDFSGRASDPARAAFNMADMRTLIETSPTLGTKFEFIPQVAFDAADPPEFSSSDYIGINAKMSEFSGGLVEPGTLVVHLETDVNGNVKTTAADLVRFFDNPTSEESKAVLEQLGISVSLVDPTNGATANCGTDLSRVGLGLLEPTYLPVCEGDGNPQIPDIEFTSFGTGTSLDYPTGEVISANGLNSSFQITALKTGTDYNNVLVRVQQDPNGTGVKYNSATKELVISFSGNEPPTANEVIAMINGDSNVSSLFRASNVASSDGTGVVASGDQTRLTGGVKVATSRPTATTTAREGANAVFQITGKKADGSLDGATLLIVDDYSGTIATGPNDPKAKVAYDSISKQLTVSINPNNPPTAREVVDVINGTKEVSTLFAASIPERIPGTQISPDGTGLVHSGDGAMLKVEQTGSALGIPMIGNSDKGSVGLAIYSVDYGSNAFVSVKAIQGTDFPVIDSCGNVSERATGLDIVAIINNMQAVGSGQVASMSTTDLDVSLWIDPTLLPGSVFGFRITGGGALMQLGPDADSLSQARIAFKDIHTTKLGGVSGFLSELRTGSGKDLFTDTKAAYKIVSEAIEEISFQRGLIGSFQKNQVEVGAQQMSDILEASTSAESDIRDTDFALSSSLLARQQVLIQAGVSVLGYPNEMNRQLLGLLQR